MSATSVSSGPLYIARCCREWVLVGPFWKWPVGRCGLCGQVPVPVNEVGA